MDRRTPWRVIVTACATSLVAGTVALGAVPPPPQGGPPGGPPLPIGIGLPPPPPPPPRVGLPAGAWPQPGGPPPPIPQGAPPGQGQPAASTPIWKSPLFAVLATLGVVGLVMAIRSRRRGPAADAGERLDRERARARAEALARRNAQLANTDALTGLANRRRLDGDLAALGGAPAGGVGFVMIDIDHFKAFNDAYGHPAGDAMLREVGRVIASAVRQGDVVYRFGGEEFAALLPGASMDDARAVGERIHAALRDARLDRGIAQPGGYMTCSVGVTRGANGEPGTVLVDAADRALYAAKRSGRDRVVTAVPA